MYAIKQHFSSKDWFHTSSKAEAEFWAALDLFYTVVNLHTMQHVIV